MRAVSSVISSQRCGLGHGLFSVDPPVIDTGTAYLRIVGPAYRFLGLGMALYFASRALRDFYIRC
jgi:hypothetical protein